MFIARGPEGAPFTYLATCLRSSSFVLVHISGGTSAGPAACFLHVFFCYPGKPPRSPTETKDDEDEGS
jgi:hypothetical protein